MLNINFYCRPCKMNKLGYAPIEMSVTLNGKRTMIQLQQKQKPEDFKKAYESKKSNPIKDYCDTARKKLDELEQQMMVDNVPLTVENIKDYFRRGGVAKVYTLGNLFTEYLAIQNRRVGVDLGVDTYNRYVKTCTMFKECNNLTDDVPAKLITPEHFTNYDICLRRVMQRQTSCNYLQKIKSIFAYAFQNGKIPSNPSFGFKIDKGKADTILYLTEEELQKIKDKHFHTCRLEEVKDCFIFACYTGLAISDLSELVPEDFKENELGQIYIEKRRVKTGVKFCCVVLKEAREIAEKYHFKLPVKSGQKMNEYLAEIADLCGIEKHLTTHTARHTACRFLLNHRNPVIPNETIIRVMGWTNEKQLRHYANILNDTVFQDMAEVDK